MSIASMVLKVKGVTGESNVGGHVGEIDVVSVEWGMEANHSLYDGGPTGAASMRTINVVKMVDRATPALFSYLDNHRVVDSATLTVSKSSGGTPLEYVVIDMTKVRIVKIDLHSDGADLMERVSMSCETVTFNYTPQASTGQQESGQITFQTIHPPGH